MISFISILILGSGLNLVLTFPLRLSDFPPESFPDWEISEDGVTMKYIGPSKLVKSQSSRTRVSVPTTHAPSNDIQTFLTSLSAESIYDSVKSSSLDVIADVESLPDVATNLTNQYLNGTTIREVEAQVENTASNVYQQTSNVATEMISSISTTAVTSYDKAANMSQKVYDEVKEKTSSWWEDSTTWISGCWSSVGNFFSRSWSKVVTWWRELEDEVKEFINIIVRVVEVGFIVIILLAVLWGYNKARKAYRYVKKHAPSLDNV